MDYRSDEARYINRSFAMGMMQAVNNSGYDRIGFSRRDSAVFYGHDKKHGLVRIDGTPPERVTVNKLSEDKTRFTPVEENIFYSVDRIDYKKYLSQHDLVPPQTKMQFTKRVVLPQVCAVAGMAACGNVIGAGVALATYGSATASVALPAVVGTFMGVTSASVAVEEHNDNKSLGRHRDAAVDRQLKALKDVARPGQKHWADKSDLHASNSKVAETVSTDEQNADAEYEALQERLDRREREEQMQRDIMFQAAMLNDMY